MLTEFSTGQVDPSDVVQCLLHHDAGISFTSAVWFADSEGRIKRVNGPPLDSDVFFTA